ncbi:MAG: glycosyltransferase family 2 protein [Candidatus Thermoplasmatota archaeon]|nr:glycosyltransferase family 2 protein [Candidatus Thermoplasmatota archaeon]MBS3790011.1 glycosyltransferase family 2 protein [Candidatus Thermoplasmatota archaeon]
MGVVSVIVPTLNEKEAIESVIDELPEEKLQDKGHYVELIAVDGGSSDGTVEILEMSGVEVLHSDGGKAEGVREGLKNADGDFVFLIDGDGTYPAEEIPSMVEELENGSEMVLGSRFKGDILNGAMSTKNKVGNKILTWLANKLYGTDISDLCTGLRGFKYDGLDPEEVPGNDFEIEAGLHSLFSEKDITEVSIEYRQRKGESKLITIDGLKIALRLLKEKF